MLIAADSPFVEDEALGAAWLLGERRSCPLMKRDSVIIEWTLAEAGNVMLVLSRKVGERIFVGDQVTITVVRITGGGVRLGIEAPPNLLVVREELKAHGKPAKDASANPNPQAAVK